MVVATIKNVVASGLKAITELSPAQKAGVNTITGLVFSWSGTQFQTLAQQLLLWLALAYHY